MAVTVTDLTAKQHQLMLMALKPGLFQPPMDGNQRGESWICCRVEKSEPTCRGARWFFGGIGTGRR
jgi:hypothetical protein